MIRASVIAVIALVGPAVSQIQGFFTLKTELVNADIKSSNTNISTFNVPELWLRVAPGDSSNPEPNTIALDPAGMPLDNGFYNVTDPNTLSNNIARLISSGDNVTQTTMFMTFELTSALPADGSLLLPTFAFYNASRPSINNSSTLYMYNLTQSQFNITDGSNLVLSSKFKSDNGEGVANSEKWYVCSPKETDSDIDATLDCSLLFAPWGSVAIPSVLGYKRCGEVSIKATSANGIISGSGDGITGDGP